MKYRSLLIPILFLTISFATISTTLFIKGSSSIGVNEADFNVYFSDALVNGIQDLSIVVSERELKFSTTLKSKNESYIVDYDVTNGSKNYDASLVMTCTGGNEYLTVNNEFDTVSYLAASKTRSGKLTITLRKQYTGDSLESTISCTITATGVERTELETETPASPVESKLPKWIYIDSDSSGTINEGDVYTLASNENEKFNVISQTEDTVTMLAVYNLDSNYRQSERSYVNKSFADLDGWEYYTGPKEVDIQEYDGNVKTYVNEYVSYLQTETQDTTISGNLITLSELEKLECAISEDYTIYDRETCENSSYISWLNNDSSWWTRSISNLSEEFIWTVVTDPPGKLWHDKYNLNNHAIRPTITVSKSSLNNE